MGFFSWNCKHCGKEILAPYPTSKWSQCVALVEERFDSQPTTEMYFGEYDGYGRIDGMDLFCDDIEMYHRHCWHEAGEPDEFIGPSDSAPNQGYFFSHEELIKDYDPDNKSKKYAKYIPVWA